MSSVDVIDGNDCIKPLPNADDGGIKPLPNADEKTDTKRLVSLRTFIWQYIHATPKYVDIINNFISDDKRNQMDFSSHKQIVDNIDDVIISEIFNNILEQPDLSTKINGNLDIDYSEIKHEVANFIWLQVKTREFLINTFEYPCLDLFTLKTYSEDMYKKIIRVDSMIYYLYFQNYCGQKINIDSFAKSIIYSGYTYNIETDNLEQFTEFPSENGIPFVISCLNNTFYMESIDILMLNQQINDNIMNRFVFFPIIFCKADKTAHIAFIIFDNQYLTVSIFDPNGVSTYFNQYLNGGEGLVYLNSMFREYMQLFCQHTGKNYTYIFIQTANSSLNTLSDTSYSFDVGHCVPISLMFIYMLTQHQHVLEHDPITEMFGKLMKFPIDAQSILKYNFASNVYDFIITLMSCNMIPSV
jgi:hypothetical protein